MKELIKELVRLTVSVLLLLIIVLGLKPEDYRVRVSASSAHSHAEPEPTATPPSDNDLPDERGPTFRITSHSGRSPVEPPTATDEVFVADEGGYLDQYLFREDVPGGKLTFNIYIDRYYSNQMQFDGDGFLTNYQELVNKKILPQATKLTLEVWDVDHDSTYDGDEDGIPDPEVDYVYVNGELVVDSYGQPKKLTSGNETWSTWTAEIPIEWLKFPQSKGSTTQTPAPVANEIAIDIDTTTPGYWAVECDWGSLKIETPVRPVLLVHGFQLTGALGDGRNSWTSWYDHSTGEGWLTNEWIPADAVRVGGWASYEDNAATMASHIAGFKNEYGVDKIYIVGHSKGGLDSRAYLAGHEDVPLLVQIASPNSGAFLADVAKGIKIIAPINNPIAAAFLKLIAEPAATQLTTPYMAVWNLLHGKNSKTIYVSYAGNNSLGGWCDGACYLPGPDDWVVRVSEVHALSYASHPTHTTDDSESKHSGLIHARAVFDEVIAWIRNPGLAQAQTHAFIPGAEIMTEVPVPQVTDAQVGEVSTGETESQTLTVEGADQLTLTLLWGEGDLDSVVYMPDGTFVDPSIAAVRSDIEFEVYEEVPGLKTENYLFQNPEAGTWTVEVSGVDVESQEGYVVVGFFEGSAVELAASTDAVYYGPGDSIVITAELTEAANPLTGATVMAHIQKPDESTVSTTMYDDGSHGDQQANDGIYTSAFADTLDPGYYGIIVVASGSTTSGHSFTRSDSLEVSVSVSTSQLNDSYADHGVDTDGNGLYNQLVIEVGVDVSTDGEYALSGSLVDSSGIVIEQTSTQASLVGGSQIMSLVFDGNLIGQHYVDGPYYLKDLSLADEMGVGPVLLDHRADAYTTSFYAYTEFERPEILLTGNNSDTGVDTDGDGLYDYLAVALEFDVVSPGTYDINARLVDSNGDEIVWATTSANFSSTGVVQLQFDGLAIREHGIDGPYVVTDLSIFQSTGGAASATFDDVHVTSAYHFWEFEGAVTDIIQVTTDPADDWRPAIARTSDGKLWVVWHSWRSDNNIWYKTSDDSGVTWSAGTQLTTDPSSDYDPAIMQASDGTIWVVWYSYRSGNADIWYKTSTDGGATWSAATQLTTDPSSDYSPAITQAGDGTIWVVWDSWRNGNAADLYYKTSTDGGATWSLDIRLTTDESWDQEPSITHTADGAIWIAWHSWRTWPGDIYYKMTTDGGATWSPDTRLTTDAEADWAAAITQTTDGTLCIGYQSHRSGNWDIWYQTSVDGGTTWSTPQQFTRFTGFDYTPALTSLPDDRVGLVWYSDRAVNNDIWFGIIGIHGDVNPPPHLDEIEHDPRPNPDSNDTVTIRADVSDETGIASVLLKWLEDGTPQADLTMYDDGAHDDYGAGDGWYGVQIGPFPVGTIVGYQVEITDVDGNTILAPQYPMQFESLEPFVKTADILFVPDYGGYDTGWFRNYYEDALIARGYQYDVWDTGKRGEIDSTTLNQYTNGAVIWAVPYWGFVTDYDSTRNTLQSYLDNGGNLFITGQDIGRSLAGTDFYQNYLHADYVQDNIGLYVLSGVAGDPIGDGLSLSITGGDGANNQYSPDEIDPVSPAMTILTYIGGALGRSEVPLLESTETPEHFVEPGLPVPQGQPTRHKRPEEARVSAEPQGAVSSGSGALRVDTGIYKVVYFAFGFEGINGHGGTSRPTVLSSVLNWFGFPPPVVPVIAIDGYVIDDDTLGNSYGNSDGIANPGEFLELDISLANTGTGTAYGVYAVPSTSDPYVNPYGIYFFDDNLWYGDIAEGTTVTGDDFDFMISADAPDGHVIDFALDIYDAYGDSWTDSFNVIVTGNDTTPPAIDNADVNPKYTPVGNPVNIIAFIREGGELTSVTADIESPDETVVDTITLHDDGNHNDGDAGDRWFGRSWIPTIELSYYVDLAAVDDHGNLGTANNVGAFTSKPFVKTADILFVPDYGGNSTDWFRPYFTNALDSLGYSYDVWDTGLRSKVYSDTLNLYTDGVVIWASPDWGYFDDSDVRPDIEAYLDAGGRLFMSGQDVAQDLNGTALLSDYLHATWIQDRTELYALNGVAGDPIGDGLTLGISGGDGANNQYDTDEIDPIAPAVTVFTYDTTAVTALAEPVKPEAAWPERKGGERGAIPIPAPWRESQEPPRKPVEAEPAADLQGIISSGTAALRVDTGTYKVVYFAFGFEGINAAADRNLVMRRVMTWLGGTATAVRIDPPQASVYASNTVTVDIRIEDVTDLYGAEVHLSFDPARIEVVDADPARPGTQIQEGTFPDPGQGFVATNNTDNSAGTIDYAMTLLSPAPAVSGSGVVASITFHGKAEGTSPIAFVSVLLSDPSANEIPATSEDGSITVIAAGNIAGKVFLQGRQDHTGATVTANPGGYQDVTGSDGSYAISNVPAGTYTVIATMPGYLCAERSVVNVTAGQTTTLPDVTLIAGDANNDDTINIFDLVIVGNAFGSSPPSDARADINGDGTVNIFDLVLVGNNFGKSAPSPWP